MSSGRKLYFRKFIWNLKRRRNCFRDVGLHLYNTDGRLINVYRVSQLRLRFLILEIKIC